MIDLHIRPICILSVVLVAILSNNFHNSSQGYRLQPNTNTSKQSLYKQSTGMKFTNNNSMISRALAFNQSNLNDANKMQSKMSSGELGRPSNGISTNVERYVDQLSKSNPTEIATFPINDLPSETAVNVLKGLSVENLYKVLRSISIDDLSMLLQRLPQDQVNEILNKLPVNQKSDIQTRITS
jgi:Mg/Co/Ni transporter MgtE